MPIEIKVILLFGVCWLIYESLKIYIKGKVIKIINDNEKSNNNK